LNSPGLQKRNSQNKRSFRTKNSSANFAEENSKHPRPSEGTPVRLILGRVPNMPRKFKLWNKMLNVSSPERILEN